MSARKKKPPAARPPRVRNGRDRQRLRLIDACISALHVYGPSRTTVEKVVAIAKMSPGIVRFYFDSKAAMLVASLQFLAAEFEEQVLIPVSKLKSTPIVALRLLVDLYLDADIASTRKVSVWYAFWGEASSRQEYYDICGQKDESFTKLTRELIEGVIRETSAVHLDADGVALGLIGALEILWQDLAFQNERDVDRVAAKARCLKFLRSVFPGHFDLAPETPKSSSTADTVLFGWAYRSAGLLALERESLFRESWAVVGHESEIPRPGDFLAADIGAERALLVRTEAGTIHAMRNNCPCSPHALVLARRGRFGAVIECALHGLKFSLDGRHAVGESRTDLRSLGCHEVGGLLFVKSPSRSAAVALPAGVIGATAAAAGARTAADIGAGLVGAGARAAAAIGVEAGGAGAAIARAGDAFGLDAAFVGLPAALAQLGSPTNIAVCADWKVIVESWLQAASSRAMPEREDGFKWTATLAGWSAERYASLCEHPADCRFRRQFLFPNQLLESRPDGVSVLQVWPVDAGRSVVRRLDYTVLPPDHSAYAALYLARRLGPYSRSSTLAMAESIQQGVSEFGYGITSAAVVPVARFRSQLAARIPALLRERAPEDA